MLSLTDWRPFSATLLKGGKDLYRIPAHFFGAVQKIYPLIAAYIRTFLCEVERILPILAVNEAVGSGRCLLSSSHKGSSGCTAS